MKRVTARLLMRVGTCQLQRVRIRLVAMVAVVVLVWFRVLLVAPVAHAAGCGQAPEPLRPTAGLVAVVDSEHSVKTAATAYDRYGYAGMVWYAYDTSCSPLAGVASSGSSLDTWAGNTFFNGAKVVVATTNGMHYAITGDSLLRPIDDAIKAGAQRVYSNVFMQLLGVVALLLSLVMLVRAWRGDLAGVSRRGVSALAGLWLASSSLALFRLVGPWDATVMQLTTDMQAGVFGDSDDPAARDEPPQQLFEQVVYRSWLRGEFGSPDAPQARQYGLVLLDAQAFTWDELRAGADVDPAVIERKKAAYTDTAGKLGPATDAFTGVGGSRFGAGFLALGQALCYAVFLLVAKLIVLFSQLGLRLLVVLSPLLGLVGLVQPDALRRVAKVAGSVALGLLVLSVLAGVDAVVLRALMSSDIALFAQLSVMVLVTLLLGGVGLRFVGRPWRLMQRDLSGLPANFVPPEPGLWRGRLRRARYERWEAVRQWWAKARAARDDEDIAHGQGQRYVRMEGADDSWLLPAGGRGRAVWSDAALEWLQLGSPGRRSGAEVVPYRRTDPDGWVYCPGLRRSLPWHPHDRLMRVLTVAAWPEALSDGVLPKEGLDKFLEDSALHQLEAAARLQDEGRIEGLGEWMRYNSVKKPREFRNVLLELETARRMALENPAATVRVNEDAKTKVNSKGEPSASFDIAEAASDGMITRSVEVKSIQEPVKTVNDITATISDVVKKVNKRKNIHDEIPGELEACVYLRLRKGRKRGGNVTSDLGYDGSVRITANDDGRVIQITTLYQLLAERLTSKTYFHALDKVSLVHQDSGRVVTLCKKGATWHVQEAQ
ncbi:hypothetical protein [Amycolatopsis sp. NPDC004378]